MKISFARVLVPALVCLLMCGAGVRASWFGKFGRSVYEKGVSLKNHFISNPSAQSSSANETTQKRSSRDSRIINGRSAGPSAAVDSGDTELKVSRAVDTDDSAYHARCFFNRKPNLKAKPKLFFFSDKTHSADTLGCKKLLEISLSTVQIDADSSLELDFDEQWIKEQLLDSNLYDGTNPSFFLIHGFLASWDGDNWMCNTKDLILSRTKANVFIVDWSGGSKPMLPIDYSAAVSNTKFVAQLIAEFISSLLPMSGQSDAQRFHLIGHSLGAHICGFVGYSLGSLGRITGLDPAGPCFSTDSQRAEEAASGNGQLAHGKRRLSPESAKFVLALHTDTALFGLNENCGHYDVYVNGGHRQPECGSVSLSARFSDLLDMNLGQTFNPNIVCAHSFAHQIVDTFVRHLPGADSVLSPGQAARQRAGQISAAQVEGLMTNVNQDPKCFPMAYKCANWAAFRAGECGYCADDHDEHCLYTGLTLPNDSQSPIASEFAGRSADEQLLPAPTKLDDDADEGDDGLFNDEDNDESESDDARELQKSTLDNNNKTEASDLNSRDHHFIRSAKATPSCMYSYQLVLAASKSQMAKVEKAQRYYYYLDLPLEESGQLMDAKNQRLRDRLIQVSHKVKPQSEVHQFLSAQYMNALKQRRPDFSMGKTDNHGSSDDDIEFYTALITFKQAPADECKNGDNDGATRSKKWQLCKPLINIQEARLWSSCELKLNAVQWVGMNYMSGLRLQDRVANSWLFERDLTEGLKARNELDESSRADISSLTADQSNSIGNKIAKPVGCLLSFLDQSDSGKASTNFKCNRSSRELKYTIKLKALKQEQPL